MSFLFHQTKWFKKIFGFFYFSYVFIKFFFTSLHEKITLSFDEPLCVPGHIFHTFLINQYYLRQARSGLSNFSITNVYYKYKFSNILSNIYILILPHLGLFLFLVAGGSFKFSHCEWSFFNWFWNMKENIMVECRPTSEKSGMNL